MALERPNFAVNGNAANCGRCVFLEKNHKIDNYFYRRIGVNIKIVRECETGPVVNTAPKLGSPLGSA